MGAIITIVQGPEGTVRELFLSFGWKRDARDTTTWWSPDNNRLVEFEAHHRKWTLRRFTDFDLDGIPTWGYVDVASGKTLEKLQTLLSQEQSA